MAMFGTVLLGAVIGAELIGAELAGGGIAAELDVEAVAALYEAETGISMGAGGAGAGVGGVAGAGAGVAATEETGLGAGGTSSEGLIYRSGGSNPGSLKLRPGEDGLSFRDSVSNPLGTHEPAVFKPGSDYISVDSAKLPAGSVVRDNVPEGHVTVRASPQEVKAAIVGKGRFPD